MDCPRSDRFALKYLTKNWEELAKFHEAFGGIDLDEMKRAVEPTLLAEGEFQWRPAGALHSYTGDPVLGYHYFSVSLPLGKKTYQK